MEAVELEEDESEAIDILQRQLSQLLDCVREISIEWQTHFDRIQMNATGTAVSQQGGTSFRLTIELLKDQGGPGLTSQRNSWNICHLCHFLALK